MDKEMHPVQTTRSVMQLKGKTGNRGWARLPPDVLRIVLNQFIREYDSYPVPTSWEEGISWPNRMLYTAIRTAGHIQQYMHVCRSWRAALNNHPFWAHICSLIDPASVILSWRKNALPTSNSSVVPDIRLNCIHYFMIRGNCCIACRMRSPLSREGFGSLKRLGSTIHTGKIGLCRDHKTDTYCGACLRVEQPHEDSVDEFFDMVICKNEDDEVFPEIDATCTKCRTEAIVRRSMNDVCLKEAYSKLQRDRSKVDWEVRHAIEQYIEYGEGSVQRVVNVSYEKSWLHQSTKIGEFLEQAVASVRYQNREEGYESADEISDDDDVLCFQEEAGVRDIAMGDFCHNRIVDGMWTVPYDSFVAFLNHGSVPFIAAFNPIPYMFPVKQGEHHPSKRSVDCIPPPTHNMASSLSQIFHKEMQRVLVPALKNLVRKLVHECHRIGAEPSVRASKMDVEDILQGLREEGVWWDDFDWVAKWEENEKRSREEEEVSSSSASDYSSTNSHQTSPVLSTSTLQTTPSPPPIEGGFADKVGTQQPQPPPAPVRPPSILRIVPCVPESSVKMPHYTKDILRQLWREASGPLFHCKCTICTRAMSNATDNSAANAVAELVPAAAPPPVVVPIEEVFEEEEEEEEEVDLEEELQQALALERELNASSESDLPAAPPIVVPSHGRKRSSEELTDDSEMFETSPASTPTKRVKLQGPQDMLGSRDDVRRRAAVKKRSSEEMESDAGTEVYVPQKRVKQVDVASTPRAMSRQGSYMDAEGGGGAVAAQCTVAQV